ncbi:MAG TPA: WD40 repeat domain-containing protein [Pyrinomonadaceae bacterium]
MHASAETLIERAAGILEGRRLSGHTDFPACMAFSPDASLLASGSYDQSVRVWDVSTGRMLWKREDHWPMALSVAFSPDGRTLACTGERRNRDYSNKYGVWLYDVKTGRILRRLGGHASYVNWVAFSPDGRMLATASNDRTLKLWDLDDDPRKYAMDRLAFTLLGHTGVVWHVSFSPDGQLLASASGDGTVRIWHLPNRFESHILKHTARTVAFSPDGRTLASDVMESDSRSGAAPKFSLLLTEVETGRALREVTPVSNLLALGWTPDASVIALRSEHSLRLLHAESGRLIYAQPMEGGSDGRGYVRPLCVSPDGRLIATFTGGPRHDLQLWDISALGVGPTEHEEKTAQPRAATVVAADASLREHLRTLPLAHTALRTPARAARWLRSSAAATALHPPLCIVQDLGALLTQPRPQLELMRPAHLPPGVDTSAYLNLLLRLAAHPLLREVSTWSISDAMTGIVIARLVAGLSFPEIYNVPVGVEALAFSERLGAELNRADPGMIWRETPVAERPNLTRLLPADSLARIEANLRRMDADELRFIHRYGPRFAGSPDPREMLDIFNLLDLPPAVRLALTQVLRLLPRVSQAVHKSGAMQTYAMGGYAGLTHRGSLDSLVPVELAYPSQMLLHRLLNQEALYYGRESERERQREVAYIVTQAGMDVRGDAEVLARALTLALAQAMQGRGYEVRQSFAGSHWTEPASMSRPSDVQRLLYYRDEGALRPKEMLTSVLGQLRVFRERYRGLHVIWVIGEHWDADEREENRDLYATLRASAKQQAWLIRRGGAKAGRAEPPAAAKAFGHSQLIESDMMWARREPTVVMYVPPVEAQAETVVAAEKKWVEPVAPRSRVLVVSTDWASGVEVHELIFSELRKRGHMVMGDGSLTNEAAWLAGLRNVEMVIPVITKSSARNAVIVAAVQAARELAQRGEGPRPLPVRIAYEGPAHKSLGDALAPSQCFVWRSSADNEALLRAMLEALAPAPSLLRFDGMYHQPFTHPTELREWFRFYPDGRVIGITTTEGTPENATRWLGEELREGTARVGRYDASGSRVRMSFKVKGEEGGVWSYTGLVGDNSLSLDGTHNGVHLTHTRYQFVVIPDFNAAPPAPPVRGVRLDGVYTNESFFMDSVHPDRAGWDRNTLRFRADGTVSFAYSGAWGDDAPALRQPEADDPQGTYTSDETSVEITMRSSSGEPRVWYGTIRADTITLIINNETRRFSFVVDA